MSSPSRSPTDGYQPDIILSIARGGLFVAGALGYALDVKNLHVANVEFYTGVDERLPVPIMLPPVPNVVDLSGAKVLVADDVADTGATLKLVRDFCAATWPTSAARWSTRSRTAPCSASTCGAAPTGGSTSRGRRSRRWSGAPSQVLDA